MSMDEFLSLGLTDFMRKFQSIPESEPLYTIIKSRTLDTSKIKNKEERKYWNRLKRLNAIPSEYISTNEIMFNLSKSSKEFKL